MITVEIAGHKATVELGKWTSTNKNLASMLNAAFNRNKIADYSPFVDLTLANMAVEKLNAKILDVTDKPEYVKGRIY